MKRRFFICFAGMFAAWVLPVLWGSAGRAEDSAIPSSTRRVQAAPIPSIAVCASAGNYFAVATRCGRIKCRSLKDGVAIRTLHHCHPRAMSFSPDGLLLAVVGIADGRRVVLKVWNVASGEVICKHLTLADEVPRLGFSEDGRAVVLRSASGKIESIRVQ